MFGGAKAAERRREALRLADAAAENALDALAEGDVKRARDELSTVPKKLSYADGGWKPALALAVVANEVLDVGTTATARVAPPVS
mgnify:CR=1 FL=1